MPGDTAQDPMAAFKEAAKAVSVKKGLISKVISDDDATVTGSRRKTMVKVEPTSSCQGKKLKDSVLTRSARQSTDIGRSSGGYPLFSPT
ncbi:hypothetical protein HID58_048527 [Brassica napus]|uniref:Uncharacterized protein n=1 Tax=Brassica napus TaxID=3708 RepID=A0ABQ8B2C6_BRANA|nr:hypothetical protein HID58_048527 [Brassica napus]